jgi:hypothetical protein
MNPFLVYHREGQAPVPEPAWPEAGFPACRGDMTQDTNPKPRTPGLGRLRQALPQRGSLAPRFQPATRMDRMSQAGVASWRPVIAASGVKPTE